MGDWCVKQVLDQNWGSYSEQKSSHLGWCRSNTTEKTLLMMAIRYQSYIQVSFPGQLQWIWWLPAYLTVSVALRWVTHASLSAPTIIFKSPPIQVVLCSLTKLSLHHASYSDNQISVIQKVTLPTVPGLRQPHPSHNSYFPSSWSLMLESNVCNLNLRGGSSPAKLPYSMFLKLKLQQNLQYTHS